MRKFALSLLTLLLSTWGLTQTNCPAIPTNSDWDTTCFIPTEHSNGKLLLPQAFFANKYNGASGQAAIIPENRPTWALGMAHAWSFSRNINKSVDYPKISYWMATVTQESQWGCDNGAVWPGGLTGSPVGITVPNVGDDGCYQIEGINNGSAYGALIQYYPLRFRKNEHQNLIGGDNVATSALVKAYYDLFTERIAEFRWGWDYIGTVESTCDPYAFEKLSASAYNAGIYGFQTAESFMGSTSCYWTGLPATTGGYATQVGDMISVLEQNTAYPVTTFDKANSNFLGYYSEDISWADLNQYFDEIDDMYWEVDFTNDVLPNAQAAWESIAGSTANDINFQDIGPVLDQIILSLPREDAMGPALTIDGAPVGDNGVKCDGDLVPYSYIKPQGSTTFCEGLSLELVADVIGGGGANPTYQWFLDGVAIPGPDGNARTYIVSGTAGSYTYSLEVCNDLGCYMASCDVAVTIEDCGGCGMTVLATTQNTPCKGMEAGSINFTIAGNSSNDYTVEYEGTTSRGNVSGSIQSSSLTGVLSNLPDGDYNVIVTDNTIADCRAYTTAQIGYTTFVNEYVEGEVVNIDNCEADLEANIIELPAPCQFLVQIGQAQLNFPAPGDTTSAIGWEQWHNAIIQPSNGGAQTVQLNTYNVSFPYNQWTTLQADYGRYYFTMSTGDSLNLYSQLLTGVPGATQASVYKYEVFDDQGDLVFKGYSIPGTSTAGDGVDLGYVGTYKAQCPYTPPAYDFAWAPAISNQVDTDVQSTGTTSVDPATDKEVIVTATNRANSQCFTVDTIVVPFDPTCLPSCDDPGTITLENNAAVIAGTIDLCSADLTAGYDITTEITASSGTFDYELFLNNSTTGTINQTGVFSLTSAGDYYVVVTDATDNTCIQQSNTITLNELTLPTQPSFTTSSLTVCEGETGVAYEIGAIAGSTGYTWSYTGTNATITGATESVSIDFASNATSGDLDVYATNSCGDGPTESISISVNALPSFTVAAPSAQCNGSIDLTDGAIVTGLNPSDAVVSVYSDNTASTGATNPVTVSGTYYLRAVKDGCESSIEPVVVTINSKPAIPTVADVQLCEGDQLDLTVSSPDVLATYTWSVGTAGNSYSGAGSSVTVNATSVKVSDEGTYELVMTKDGCDSDPATVNVAIDAQPAAASVTNNSLDVCVADAITLNGDAATNNGSGTWTFTTSGSATLVDVNDPTTAVNGLADGEILNATWTINSENGYCTPSDASVTVAGQGIAAPGVTLTADLTDVCEGTSVVFTATGTTAGSNPQYTFYDYTGGARGAELQAQSTSSTLTLTSTTSDLEVEVELLSNSTCLGGNTPTVSSSTTVTVDAAPGTANIVETDFQTCLDQVDLTADAVTSGVISWNVTNGPGSVQTSTDVTSTIDGLVAGQMTEVTLTISSANDLCTAETDVVNIDKLGQITAADVVAQSSTLCFDASYPALSGNSLQAGETEAWASLGGATISASGNVTNWVVGENKYVYTISNAGGCSDSDTVTITIDEVPTAATVGSTITTCTDPVNLNATAPSVGSGVWTVVSGVGNIVTGQETNHVAEVENLDENTDLVLEWTVSNGACVNHSNAQVTVDLAGQLTAAEISINGTNVLEGETAIVCEDNFTVSASTPSGSGPNVESGVWTIGTPANLSLGDMSSDAPTVTSSNKGSTSLTWTISTTLAGCQPSVRTINVDVIDVPETNPLDGVVPTAVCLNDVQSFATTSAQYADDYEWMVSGGTQASTTVALDNYSFGSVGAITISVAARNICGTDATPESTTVTVNPIPSVTTSDYQDCDDGTAVDLSSLVNAGTASVTYYTNTSATSDIPSGLVTGSGSYGVVATENGCSSPVGTINVTLNTKPSTPSAGYDLACLGENFNLVVNGSSSLLQYSWLDDNNNAIGSGTSVTRPSSGSNPLIGTYGVYATSNGCSSDTGFIDVYLLSVPTPAISYQSNDVTDGALSICSENLNEAFISAVPSNAIVTWSNGNQFLSSSNDLDVDEAGTYTLTLDNGTCTASAFVEVNVQSIGVVITSSESAIDLGQNVTLFSSVDGGGDDLIYSWSDQEQGETYPASSQITFEPEITDNYTLTVLDQNSGCIGESNAEEVVVYQPVEIASAFSPNGDGLNETWDIPGIEDYELASVSVYSRWGQKVFESYGAYTPWDGTGLKGNDLPQATYYYIIQLNDERGTKYDGDVTIIR